MKRLFPITCVVSCTLLLGVLWRGAAQDTSKPAPNPRRDVQLEKKLAELPIVDFTAADNSESTDPTRDAKNRLHNSPVSPEGGRRPTLAEDLEPVLLELPLTHQRPEPAFPVASDVIVLGTITETQAYLSTDRTGVYSEVSVSIEDILKPDSLFKYKSGDALKAERTGGAVRFPSGTILRRGKTGRDLPSKGRRYLLFLNQTAAGGFSIVTGYELTETGAVPLDSVRGYAQFENYESYRNVSEASLLEAVRKAISQHATGLGGP